MGNPMRLAGCINADAVVLKQQSHCLTASCGNGGEFPLPGDRIGTYEADADTITISADSITYEPTGSQTEIGFMQYHAQQGYASD